MSALTIASGAILATSFATVLIIGVSNRSVRPSLRVGIAVVAVLSGGIFIYGVLR